MRHSAHSAFTSPAMADSKKMFRMHSCFFAAVARNVFREADIYGVEQTFCPMCLKVDVNRRRREIRMRVVWTFETESADMSPNPSSPKRRGFLSASSI